MSERLTDEEIASANNMSDPTTTVCIDCGHGENRHNSPIANSYCDGEWERCGCRRYAEAACASPPAAPPEAGTPLAPWYEADGSTVMLPAEEVERRRRLAAKVIDAAREMLDAPGSPFGLRMKLAGALDDLDAASPASPEATPAPTPGASEGGEPP